MALYALGDMHLSFAVNKPMDPFGRIWRNHEKKIEKNCRKLITDEDTFVITGDHSWGRNLSESEEDLNFIKELPGKKILLRGNHDMFWDANKTPRLNRLFEPDLHFLQNNYYSYKDYALVGTKGYTFEGPFWINRQGDVVGWKEEDECRAKKLVEREVNRLQKSFQMAKDAGYKKYLLFLHYPPTNILEQESVFTRMAQEYGVSHVVYSHCHGETRFNDSIRGEHKGSIYHLVSGDFLNFCPLKLID